ELALLLLAEGVDLLVLDVRVVQLPGHVAGVDVKPDDLLLAAVALGDRGVEHLDGAGGDPGGAADVAADAVAAQEAHDWIIGDLPPTVAIDRDACAGAGGSQFLVGRCRHGRVSGAGGGCGYARRGRSGAVSCD